MHCIERWRLGGAGLGLAGVLAGVLPGLLGGCAQSPEPVTRSVAPPPPPVATRAAPSPAPANASGLPAPGPVRSWAELRLQAAHRMVAANPSGSFTGPVPEPLLAVPVLEIELNADGSVRHIEYLRQPHEHKETLEVAAQAVRRAAPFGDVSRLPKPWRFTETFLFSDDGKFKPRTLDQ